MKLTKEGRASLQARYANAVLDALQHDRTMQLKAVMEGRPGVANMPDDDLVKVAWMFNITPAPGEIDANPFVDRLETAHRNFVIGDRQVRNTDELSEDEITFICKAVNAYSPLVALLDTAALNQDDQEPADTVKILAAHEAIA